MKISKFQDLVAHWVDSPCLRISSFGNLTHFHQSNKPKEAGDANRAFMPLFREKNLPESSETWKLVLAYIENISSALQNGPYGRCVYECDNDVADHQIVSMEFANGATVSVTMIAFTESICARKGIRFFDFLTQRRENMNPSSLLGVTELSGHGGGDFGLMESFVQAVSARITKGNSDSGSFIQSSAEETFKSHLYVFAAEHARRSGKVVDVEEFKREHGIKGVPLELKKPFI
ncbi:hypothetical protein G9A89_007018 [Geosiphon pyriformis]|nr:hypothetical protein G9A89_007018 [Geosiphon pyriformis]